MNRCPGRSSNTVRTASAALAVVTCLLSAAVAVAQDNSSKIYRSAYFLGRGDTGVACADNEEAIFYNPAGIAQGKGIYKKTVLVSPHVEVSKATRDLARRLAAEDGDTIDTVRDNVGKPNHVGVNNFTGIILRRAALGAIATSNVDLLAYKSPLDGLEVVEAKADQTAGMTFTLAEGFFKNQLLLGATGKYLMRGKGEVSAAASEADKVQETMDDQANFMGTGTGGGGDVGLMWILGGRVNPSVGLVVNDVGDTKITPEEPTALDLDVKQTVNLGFSVEPGTKYSKLRLLADYRDALGRTIENPRKKLHLGAELTVLNMIGMTGGLNQGYPTAGLYLDLYVLRFDFGFYSEELGDRVGTRPDTRYFMRIKAGF